MDAHSVCSIDAHRILDKVVAQWACLLPLLLAQELWELLVLLRSLWRLLLLLQSLWLLLLLLQSLWLLHSVWLKLRRRLLQQQRLDLEGVAALDVAARWRLA